MNKNWFQFIDGRKADWPGNELPHPKAIFKADFINQFIGWCKYLQHMWNDITHEYELKWEEGVVRAI